MRINLHPSLSLLPRHDKGRVMFISLLGEMPETFHALMLLLLRKNFLWKSWAFVIENARTFLSLDVAHLRNASLCKSWSMSILNWVCQNPLSSDTFSYCLWLWLCFMLYTHYDLSVSLSYTPSHVSPSSCGGGGMFLCSWSVSERLCGGHPD